jgi:hypothetical protein
VRRELRIIDCPVVDGEGRGRRDPCALEICMRPQAQNVGWQTAHLFS